MPATLAAAQQHGPGGGLALEGGGLRREQLQRGVGRLAVLPHQRWVLPRVGVPQRVVPPPEHGGRGRPGQSRDRRGGGVRPPSQHRRGGLDGGVGAPPPDTGRGRTSPSNLETDTGLEIFGFVDQQRAGYRANSSKSLILL